MNTPTPPKLTDEILVHHIPFTHKDIFTVVNDFYHRVQTDPLLQVPFKSVHNWPEHIQRITHFWWIRFGGTPYMSAEYNPVLKHFFAGFNAEFLERWLQLFHATLHTHLNDQQRELWALISVRMGHSLSIKNEYFREHYEQNKTPSHS